MWEIWLDELIEFFDTSYGTTSFFTNPYQAQSFVENKIIKTNPRLSDAGNPSQRDILLINSDEALTLALSQTNYAPEAATLYWKFMQEYILLNTYDDRLLNVFNIGSQAAVDTLTKTYDEDVKTTLKIPWWLFVLPFLFFIRRK